MPDVIDLANEALYPDLDNGMGMAGPPPADHRGDRFPGYTGPRGPKGEPDRRTKEGRAYLGMTPPKGGPPGGGRRGAGGSPPPRKATPTKVRPGREDYTQRILGMFQLVALPLAFKAPADAAAIELHGPGIADALNALALERPEIAAVLDRILRVGPYGALLTAVLPLLLQLAANHGIIAPMQVMGTLPPEELLEAYTAHMQAQMAGQA